MKIRHLLMLLTLTFACAHRKSIEIPSGDLVFPRGVYEHEVSVRHPQGTHRFWGVFSAQDNERLEKTLVGLTPLGTTLFKIHERQNPQEIETDFRVVQLKAHKERVLEIYRSLSLVFNIKKTDANVLGAIRKDGKMQIFLRKDDPDFWLEKEDKVEAYPKEFLLHYMNLEMKVKILRFRPL